MRSGVDLAREDERVEPVCGRQRLEELVDVFLGQRVFAPGHPGGVFLLPLLKEPGLVLALLDSQVLRLVEFH